MRVRGAHRAQTDQFASTFDTEVGGTRQHCHSTVTSGVRWEARTTGEGLTMPGRVGDS